MARAIRTLVILLVVFLGGLWAYAWVTKDPGQGLGEAFATRIAGLFGADMPVPSAGGVQMPQGLSLGGPFSLVDEQGRPVTERDFADRWLLVYFGYTFCPDVCPTELGVMAAAMDALPPAAKGRVVPVFITIDPERDTPAQIAPYVAAFHPAMRGLTGTPEQIAEVARRYRVYFARAQRPDMTEYLMDHSSFIYLVGPDGRVRALFRPGTSPEALAGAAAAQVGAAPARSGT